MRHLDNMKSSEVLQFMVDHPNDANVNSSEKRSQFIEAALQDAVEILPDGKSKRALDYILRTPGALLCFGGKDAVSPHSWKQSSYCKERRREREVSVRLHPGGLGDPDGTGGIHTGRSQRN